MTDLDGVKLAVTVKPLLWERVSEAGMEGPVRFWRAVDAFGGYLWINVLTDDFDGKCSIPGREFSNSAGAMNHLEDAYAARILSALSTTPEAPGTGGAWQDIATAPKEDRVLAYFPPSKKNPSGRVDVVYWSSTNPAERGYWVSFIMERIDGTPWLKRNQPTHWQPLPEPPATPAETQADEVGL